MQARFLLIGIILAFAFGAILGPRPASADVNFHPYIKPTSNGSGANMDPIHVLYTISGTHSNTQLHFLHHVGWTDQGGNTMYFGDHGSWQGHTDQRGSACGWCIRYHTRFNTQDDAGPAGYGTFTMGPAHYEEISISPPCGHVSVSYNSARDTIANSMSAGGHFVTWVYWGNNQVIMQCDNRGTVGDGWLVRIDVP